MDWSSVVADVDAHGFAITPVPLLTAPECADLCAGFDDDGLYRSTVDMERHRFGEGVYRYYRYPLPAAVQRLREEAYGPLAQLANTWAARLRGETSSYPSALDDYLSYCHEHGQSRPTALILRYDEGGWNALHQDLYGDVAFPFQLT